MGDAWSVFLLMWVEFAAVSNAIRRGPKLHGFTILNMIHLRDVRVVVRASKGAIYVHVDDIVIQHASLSLLLSALTIISSNLRALGFIVTATWPHEVTTVIGLEPSAGGNVLQPETLKRGTLDRGLEDLEHAPVFAPARLATCVGIYLWWGFLWRPSMSAVQVIFQ